MSEDEKAIRQVVKTWMEATQRGDTATVLDLMTDDVVFMVPGAEPFGKEEFAAVAESMGGMKINGTNEIVELQVFGDRAFIRNRIDVAVTPPGGEIMRRSGYTLTLLRKGTDGRWRLMRDANLLVPTD